VTVEARGMSAWRRSLAEYTERRVLLILPLGFASGLPLLLTFSTLSAWFATAGVSRATIGAFALVGTPYALKFLWSPLIDRLPPPIPVGRRRGWGIAIQLALIAATLELGSCNPKTELARMGALALLVAFLSASQDVVIDAYRVEILAPADRADGIRRQRLSSDRESGETPRNAPPGWDARLLGYAHAVRTGPCAWPQPRKR